MGTVEGFILAGGASRRMGQDKARLRLAGREFVELIAAELAPLTIQVRTVGAREAAGPAGLRDVPDRHPGWGALGGIETALHTCEADAALVVACDLPFVTGVLLQRLLSVGQGFDAVVPVQADGRPQPLCAVYRRAGCIDAARAAVAAGEHRPRALLGQIRTRWVSAEELADLPGAENFFLNINTPEDFAQAKAIKIG